MLTSFRYTVLPSYVEEMKAIKNETEINGLRNAYLRDGAAFVKWFAWLDEKMAQGYDITEWEAAWRLTEYRRRNKHYMGLAYESISASGPNAGESSASIPMPYDGMLTAVVRSTAPLHAAQVDGADDRPRDALSQVRNTPLQLIRVCCADMRLACSDSGGQYRDGTCDTTRTVHFGRPTPDQCEAFTRVLQGHVRTLSRLLD